METTLTPEQAAAICRHMNDDHADSIAGYARAYAGVEGVDAARMLALDADAMDLRIEVRGEHVVKRIAFDHALRDTDDARRTLIAMAQATGSGAQH